MNEPKHSCLGHCKKWVSQIHWYIGTVALPVVVIVVCFSMFVIVYHLTKIKTKIQGSKVQHNIALATNTFRQTAPKSNV